MKHQTAQAKAMTDAELYSESLRLRRSIPQDQARYDAIKREVQRRKKKAKAPA